jgi:hypothetical protein
MASTVARATEKKTNVNYVLTLLKAKPGERHTGREICNGLGISMNAKACMMRKLMAKYPEIGYFRSKGVGSYYWWEPVVDKKEKPVEDKYPAPKNNEGYSDPTASAAIDKVDKEIERKASLPKMGEVWSAKHQSGSIDLFYILWSTDTQASGIYLDSDGWVLDADQNVALTNRIFATLANHKIICVATKPIKYLLDKVGETNGIVMSRVKNTIARQLDIKPVVRYEEKEKIVYREKPVEKIVTKVVEKPVEKIVYRDQAVADIPETYVHVKDAIINDLLHQIEIYKDMLDRLIPVRTE